jgi:hypothetical protein
MKKKTSSKTYSHHKPTPTTSSSSNQQETQQFIQSANNNDSKVSIGMTTFLQVLEQYNQQQKYLEQHSSDTTADDEHKELFITREIRINGKEEYGESVQHSSTTKHNGAQFTIEYFVDILENVTKKNLLNNHRKKAISSPGWTRNDWTSVVLLRQVQNSVSLKRVRIERQISSDNEDDSSSTANECHIGLLDNSIILLCGCPGLYHVTISVDVSMTNTQQCSSDPFISTVTATSPRNLTLHIPKAVKNSLDFTINNEDVQVKVNPALYVKKQRIGVQSSDNIYITNVTCSFPSTSALYIQWTPRVKIQPSAITLHETTQLVEDDLEPVKKQQIPATITSQQNALHAIGEGLVKSTFVFDYSIVNGSVTQLDIAVNPYDFPFKILTVSANKIKKWALIDQKNNEELDTLDDAEKLSEEQQKHQKILRVQFVHGMEGSLRLKVTTEQEMGGTSAKVFVTSMNTVNSSRETGTIAVVARTNVEIKEESRKYLRRIDNTELPSIQKQSGFPILHSYQFLEKGQELYLNVTRHEDIEVLCTCIETCNYEVTLSGSKLLHKIRMNMKNSAKQYLRVHLFKDAEVWSTTIDGQTVKPSSETQKDQARLILIPLTKKEEATSMNIELIFTIPTAEKMEGRGRLDLSLAKFDAPVNVLSLSLYLPSNFNYGEFVGNMKENSTGYPTAIASGVYNTPTVYQPVNDSIERVLNRNESIESLVSKTDDLQRVSVMFNKYKASAGKKPVNLGTMDSSSGQIAFYFSRVLLLEHSTIALSVDFKEIKKSIFQRRTTGGWTITTYLIVFIILLLVAIVLIYLK